MKRLALYALIAAVLFALFCCGSTSETVVEKATLRPTFTPIPTGGEAAATEAPTAAPAPTDVPAPTEEAAPTEPPTEPPPPTDTPPPPLTIQGVTDYIDSIDALHLVGEVINGSPQSLEFVKIIASFYDDANRLIATEFTYTKKDIIEAGGKSPFEVTVLSPPEGITTYKLDVEWDTTDKTPLPVDILSHTSSTDGIGAFHVVGEVSNPYDFNLEFTKIIATFYNAGGEVVRVEFTYAKRDIIQPGQTSPFDVAVLNPPSDMDHYELQTQADQE